MGNRHAAPACLFSQGISGSLRVAGVDCWGRSRPRRDAKEVAGPSLALAGIVLGFLSLYFSDVETSQAFDLPYQVGSLGTCRTACVTLCSGGVQTSCSMSMC